MAARFPTPRYCIQHSRFTKQDGYRVRDLALSLNGNIAVTSFNDNTDRTYIDVYTTNVRYSDSRDKPKIIYSKEFEKYEDEEWIYRDRIASFIDDDVLVSCVGDKLEVFQVNKDEVLRSRRVNGSAMCLSVRERREIFIGFRNSNKITVYDVIDLNEIKSIILKGIQDGYWPKDMTAIADRIFVCVVEDKEESNRTPIIFEEKSGRILSELTKPTERPTKKWYTESLAVTNVTYTSSSGIVAAMWYDAYKYVKGMRYQIVFYSLLSENNCSFLIVEAEVGFNSIRISDRGDRMITGNHWTGEVKVYDMSEFFSYGHLKETLQSQLQEDDCSKLTDFFAIPKHERDEIFKRDAPTENLLLALEGKGVIQPSNVDRLAEAFTELDIKSSYSYLVDFYQKTRTSVFYKEIIEKLQEKKQEEVEHIKKKLERANIDTEENKAQVQNLQQELQKTKQEHKETEKLLQQTKDLHQRTALVRNKFKAENDQFKSKLSILEENLESAKQDLLQTKELLMKATKENNAIKAGLEQSQLQYSIKSMSLGNPVGDRLAETAQARTPEVRTSSKDNMTSATSGYLQDSDIASEFSKLLVKVSVELSNDHCVLLATYFNLPRSKLDLIRKDSGTPGITLLDVMKERNLINMYDVNNLQQALDDIKLCDINETLVKPYQERAAASGLLK